MYELLPDSHYAELKTPISIATRAKIKEDMKNNRVYSLMLVMLLKVNHLNKHLDEMLQGKVDGDLSKACWMIPQSFERFTLGPEQLKQYFKQMKHLTEDDKFGKLFNANISEADYEAFVYKKMPKQQVTDKPVVGKVVAVIDQVGDAQEVGKQERAITFVEGNQPPKFG